MQIVKVIQGDYQPTLNVTRFSSCWLQNKLTWLLFI